MPSAPHVENPTTNVTALAEPQKLKKLKKLIKISPAISGIWPAYRGISKLADSKGERYIVSAKYIFKPAMTPKLASPIDETKPLDLAFIDAVPFQYLTRQKNVEIFAVFMQDIKNKLNVILMKDIEYQLNKIAKTLTNPKIMVLEEYHKFLDVFLKEVSDTLSLHSKYDHQIRLLKRYKDHGHSLLSKMSEPKL